MVKIGVVIVTFNRIDKLRVALDSYIHQTIKPKYIVVIDNASNDGTKEYLAKWKSKEEFGVDKYVLTQQENIGGSGGFYQALKKAKELDANWIWVADDDAYPLLDAFDNATKIICDDREMEGVVAIAGAVYNNNMIDSSHRKRVKKGLFQIEGQEVSLAEYNKIRFPIDWFSYVGTILKKDALEAVGLPDADLFIYYDDTEHSQRLSQIGSIYCYPSIKIKHDVFERSKESLYDVDWRTYYSERNFLYLCKKHFPRQYWFAYWNEKIRTIIHLLLRKKTIKYRVINAALNDVNRDIKGLHKVYRPGWLPSDDDA